MGGADITHSNDKDERATVEVIQNTPLLVSTSIYGVFLRPIVTPELHLPEALESLMLRSLTAPSCL